MSARRRAGLAALVAVGIAAAGCTTVPGPTTSAEPTVAANAPVDINAHSRDSLANGGVLRLRLERIPTQWNPWHGEGATDADLGALVGPLTAPAFLLDAAGRASANPDTVVGVDVRHTDVTRVTLTLSEHAVWGDGEPVTAADWVATWRAMTGRIDGVEAHGQAGWGSVAEVAAGASDREVVVTYTGIEPDWAEPLVPGPLRAASCADGDAFSWAAFSPANFAGPFTVTHTDAAQGVVTLERNPRWWGDAARLERIVYRTLADDAAPAAFRNNELDLLPIDGSREVLQKVSATADATVRQAPGRSGRMLRLASDGLLADAAVRAALLLALDRAGLAAVDLAGLSTQVSLWSDPVLLPSQPGYVDQARATGLDHDTDAAKANLASAGFTTSATGVLVRGEEELRLSFRLDESDPAAKATFDALAAALAEVSIGVRATTGDADIEPVDEPVSAFPLAHLPEAAASDPVLADYVGRVDTETNPVRRADQASQLGRLLWERVGTIPLYQTPELVAVRTGLANVGADGFGTTAWEDVGWLP